MKKFFLIVLIILPTLLTAQNGIRISNFAMASGSVTFDLSWDAAEMPTMWSDSVWVFADYNKAGVMTRLPLVAGATLTATSAPGVGQVIAVPGNTQGVWVVGNARTAGNFSASVVLPSSVSNVLGACAYASNYLPTGTWGANGVLTMTGTPLYFMKIDGPSGTSTVTSNSPYRLPEGSTLLSFTDATGAPGKINCIPPQAPTNLTVSAATVCVGASVVLTATGGDNGAVSEFEWGTGTAGSGILGRSTANTYTVNPTAMTTYWVRRVSTENCGTTTAATITVAVQAAPTVTATKGGAICGSGTVSITATPSTGAVIDWYTAATGGTSVTTSNTYTIPNISTSTTYYAEARDIAANCVSASRTAVGIIITELPVISTTSPADICSNATTKLTATVSGGTTTAMTYTWNVGGTSRTTTVPSLTTGLLSANTNYTVYVTNSNMCRSNTATGTIMVYARPTLTHLSGNTNQSVYANTNISEIKYAADNFISPSVTGLPAGITSRWTYNSVTISGSSTVTGRSNYTIKIINEAGCETSVSGVIEIMNNVVGTTSVFTDPRDGQNYNVVLMPDNRWWFAQNLNYKTGLYFNANTIGANGETFYSTDNGVPAIGSYWCPSANNTIRNTNEDLCNIYGALYTWETVIMLDGKWSSEAKNSSAWSESWLTGNYSKGTNVARGDVVSNGGGRGICPKGWHVPTDYEWAVMLNGVDNSTVFTDPATSTNLGNNKPGQKLKSTAVYTGTDPGNGEWQNSSARGNNASGFNAVPGGQRNHDGSLFTNRGSNAYFWTSSAYNIVFAYRLSLTYNSNQVNTYVENRSYGYSVRCVQD